MLHHVTLEVAPADLERSVEFWRVLGFEQVEPPADLAETFTWLEREGTQVHLMRCDSPSVPPHGHPAVIAPDLAGTVERLRSLGFEVHFKRERWRSQRAVAIAPGGHRVELMASPPRR